MDERDRRRHNLRLKLQSASLEGLEPTLIRNLTDHHGNNLLHTVCYHGHVNLLPWVTRRFAGELNGALSDENRRGFTPIVYAIKVRVLTTSPPPTYAEYSV